MKKNLIIMGLILTLVMSSAIVFAESEITVKVGPEAVEFNEDMGAPFIDENSRTQVPLKAVMDKFGAEVEWNGDTRTVTIKKDDITIEVPIGEGYILQNGEKFENDAAALIKDGRTYLPIRHIIEAFGSTVEWDVKSKTVFISTETIDARAILMDAYAKSYEWKNYESKAIMNMSMPLPAELGESLKINMVMNMDLTTFSDPMKMMATVDMLIDGVPESAAQPSMTMYMAVVDGKFTTYMGTQEEGKLTWVKSTEESEALAELLKPENQEEMKTLNEESVKEVKYLGRTVDANGRTLIKLENTTSFEAYNEVLGGYVNMLSNSSNQADNLSAEMLKNMGDMTFIVYVDEETGEIVEYEMDLGPIMANMFSGMSEIEGMPAEALEMLKSLEMKMKMEIYNINNAKDFEIPEEALKAPEAETMLEAVEAE